jgi:hypothetical protein
MLISFSGSSLVGLIELQCFAQGRFLLGHFHPATAMSATAFAAGNA